MAETSTARSVQINGPALRTIRERTGMSGAALARAVGADVSFLAKIERGEKRGIGAATHARIAEVLDIDGRAVLANPYVTQVTALTVDHNGSNTLHCLSTTRTAA